MRSDLERALETMLRVYDAPEWEAEYQFCERRWRFDVAWPAAKVAIEAEGGVWTRGRHVRGAGFIADCIKYNRAALDGWRVFRLTRRMIEDDPDTHVKPIVELVRCG